MDDIDALVIGGGFYGCNVAIHLARTGRRRTVLVEREPGLLSRASFVNQARIHHGYHYPRSFTTAYRSRLNFHRFVDDWSSAVYRGFRQLYAVARRNSKVTPRQFERFCAGIGAPLGPATADERSLFDPKLIANVFAVEEFAFDARALRATAEAQLRASGVELRVATHARWVARDGDRVRVGLRDTDGVERELRPRTVINCSYSGLGQIAGLDVHPSFTLKHEIAELALIALPPALERRAITVMDGPFFSVVPFPPTGTSTLSHVRYTPHMHWYDRPGIDPYRILAEDPKTTRYERMVRDARRFVPALEGGRHEGSLFEVKTVLAKSEIDDGRPILFVRHPEVPGCYSILGGKIDNIYDALEALDIELSGDVASA